jgi:hypothetical protein
MIIEIDIITKIHNYTPCGHYLSFLPKPILKHSDKVKSILIGQAPNIKDHQSNKQCNEASGDK